ncbi:MAG TPA: diadenosine tetraphosphate hydrolase [Candidatus Paceibacterota bacterium]|nr:diadenosine tetraphosphate hydrolase [Candidatus Paceibacterota bacterium]
MRSLFPNEVVVETKNFKVAQDWEVPIPAFFIVSTIRNIRSIGEFTDEEALEFAPLVRKIRKGMEKVLGCKDVYIFQNEDSAHGFHLWMLPRYEWMEQFGRKVQSMRPILEHATNSPISDDLLEEVREKVELMKKYLEAVE